MQAWQDFCDIGTTHIGQVQVWRVSDRPLRMTIIPRNAILSRRGLRAQHVNDVAARRRSNS